MSFKTFIMQMKQGCFIKFSLIKHKLFKMKFVLLEKNLKVYDVNVNLIDEFEKPLIIGKSKNSVIILKI